MGKEIVVTSNNSSKIFLTNSVWDFGKALIYISLRFPAVITVLPYSFNLATEHTLWVANIVLSDNRKETYDLKPVFFDGDVAIFCPQNGTIYSIPDNTNSYNVFAYTVQPQYISDIENITKSGSVARITNDLLHKDNNGFKLDIKDLYGKAFNK